MTRKRWHQLHKWISIFVGVFFLLWTVTGIIMMIPPRFYSTVSVDQSGLIDYHDAGFSPAEAIAEVEKVLEKRIDFATIEIVSVLGDPIYVVYLEDGSSYLINAVSGELTGISPEVAEKIARDRIGPGSFVQEIQLLESHDLLYPFGQLPVYRIVLETDRSMYYVSAIDGSLSQSTMITRVVAAISGLHTFEPLMLITQRDTLRKSLLILTSVVGIAAALTGYFIALLPSMKRRTQSGSEKHS